MPTLTQTRQDMLGRMGIGLVILASDLDDTNSSTSAVATTDLDICDTNRTSGWLRDKEAIIYRPAAANAEDRLRFAGDITHSATYSSISIAGRAYTAKIDSDEDIEVWYDGVRPDKDVLPAIQQAQTLVSARILLPLTLVANGGMFLGTTSWTGSSAALDTEDAVMQGRGSLEVTNSGVNGMAYSAAFGVEPGATIHAWAIGLGDTGTNRVVYQDVTNGNAQLGDIQTFKAKRPRVAYQQLTVPETCYQMRVGLGGSESNAVTRWDQVFVNQEQDGRLFPPLGITEAWEFESLSYLQFARQAEAGIFDAMSASPIEVPDSDYRVSDLSGDTHTPIVQLDNRSWLAYPLVIQARLKDATIKQLADETDVTGQPLNLLVPAAIMELLKAKGYKIPDSQTLYQQAATDFDKANRMRPANGPARRQPVYHYGGMRV